jgi:hypothetical protein
MENIKTEEKKFAEEIEQTVKLYESYIPSTAIATKQMIEKYGAINAVKKLLISGKAQKGFKTLCENGHKDQTFEALVLKHKSLFSAEEISAAEFRLNHYEELK